jgi:class II lanthipeptide synthase
VAGSLTPLTSARAIAEELCASAEWQGDRCTWRDGLAMLDGDLYAGTAGVGWFLGSLARVTGDEPARRTALGALEHALAAVAGRARPRPGLHAGDLGAVWAAAELGQQLGSSRTTERARALGAAAGRRLSAEREGRADIVSGRAGTALALVALGEQRALLDVGEALLADSEVAPLGLAWPDADEPGGPPLRAVGLAHGAGGVAWALLELARATEDERFRKAALAGLAFERSWFDAGACGWRDPATVALTGSSWCRGSAGAALVRLRALALAPDERLAAETGAALASVHGSVAAALAAHGQAASWEGTNFSVCHGLMGAADVLLEAAETLGVSAHSEAAQRVAEHGVQTARARGAWPCGTLDGSPSPGLMLGLAGIGAVLLRIEKPDALPSVGRLPYSTSAANGVPRPSG